MYESKASHQRKIVVCTVCLQKGLDLFLNLLVVLIKKDNIPPLSGGPLKKLVLSAKV